MSKKHKVIHCDLDGTLAFYDGWKGEDHIGDPVLPMLRRAKRWLGEGHTVRIFTARVSQRHSLESRERAVAAIHNWCREHIGAVLQVTADKMPDVDEFWDDRAVSVRKNMGHAAKLTETGFLYGEEGDE